MTKMSFLIRFSWITAVWTWEWFISIVKMKVCQCFQSEFGESEIMTSWPHNDEDFIKNNNKYVKEFLLNEIFIKRICFLPNIILSSMHSTNSFFAYHSPNATVSRWKSQRPSLAEPISPSRLNKYNGPSFERIFSMTWWLHYNSFSLFYMVLLPQDFSTHNML